LLWANRGHGAPSQACSTNRLATRIRRARPYIPVRCCGVSLRRVRGAPSRPGLFSLPGRCLRRLRAPVRSGPTRLSSTATACSPSRMRGESSSGHRSRRIDRRCRSAGRRAVWAAFHAGSTGERGRSSGQSEPRPYMRVPLSSEGGSVRNAHSLRLGIDDWTGIACTAASAA
jgi:hypothetical protein